MEPERFRTLYASQYWGQWVPNMRHERVYARRQRAVTFAGPTRSITIPLAVTDFELLERLAAKRDVGNATLVRQIIRKYLKRQANKNDAPEAS